ncbi:outer membrane protein [Thioclava pacifica]|uniref:Uncharacterized protein n=1 Tax=Thioclava pacifica DSM 10166 TaxID=1353537 RepID=A0A074J590_9RHOB|nr:outer membrane beta-barrel protein [Thioclava pacifica]KEO50798.1 hypothetical protein TP2_14315 [Thioclava pacifica DSM 10166]
MKKNPAKIAFASGAAVLAGMASTAQAQDVAGLYGGLSYNLPVAGDMKFIGYSSDSYGVNGSQGGIFFGYNFALANNWVAGGEIAYSTGYGVDRYSEFEIKDVVDLKARFGKTFGTTLVYGVVGYSMADVDVKNAPVGGSDGNGASFGLGFETGIGSKGFIGAEVLKRHLGAKVDEYYGYKIDDMTTVSVRAGFRF